MIRKLILVLCGVVFVLQAASTDVSISGTIQDGNGQGISSVEVKLASHSDISTATDENGEFSLTGEIPLSVGKVLNITPVNRFAINETTNTIRFQTTTDILRGSVALFTVNGKNTFFLELKNHAAGIHSIILPQCANGYYLLKITVNGHSTLRSLIMTKSGVYINLIKSGKRQNKDKLSAKSVASQFIDTIVAQKTGYNSVKKSVESYSLENVTLVMEKAGGGYNCPEPNPNLFAIGMDLSFEESKSAANRQSTLEEYKSHGINYIRLRTFVNPMEEDGYDQSSGTCNLQHTIDYGKQIKEMCMGLLVDFHYSNNWADPGKQCVPVQWQDIETIDEMADTVYSYTKNAVEQMIEGGARPDMVQIGNETTPGMLIHRCDDGGLPLRGINGYNPVNGALYFWSSTDNGAPSGGGVSPGGWKNLGKLLKAGADAVRDVDPAILIALHLDRGNDLSSSRSFMSGAVDAGVPFDVFGESCYAGNQGGPSDWKNTFKALASSFPEIRFIIAEYSGEQRATNDVMYDMPDNRGVGTFNWAPMPSGNFFDVYDQLMTDYEDRL